MASNNSNGFDTLRLVAAYTVLISHSFPLSGLTEPALASYTAGTVAVMIFFAISGFLITQSWDRDPELLRFFVRRSLRIFPGLIVVVCLCALALGPLITVVTPRAYFRDHEFAAYFANIALSMRSNLPGVFESVPYPDYVNGPLWTLRFEFLMYAAIAALGVAGLIAKRHVTLLVALVTGGLWLALVFFGDAFSAATGPDQRWKQVAKLVELAPPFMVGAVLYLYRDRVRLSYPLFWLLVAGFVLCGVLDAPKLARSMAWAAIPYASIVVGLKPPALLRRLSFKSDLSYGVYIYAWPVQQLFAQYALADWGWLACTLGTLVVTTLCATASWHLVERVALSFKPKATKPARLASPPVAPVGGHPEGIKTPLPGHKAQREAKTTYGVACGKAKSRRCKDKW